MYSPPWMLQPFTAVANQSQSIKCSFFQQKENPFKIKTKTYFYKFFLNCLNIWTIKSAIFLAFLKLESVSAHAALSSGKIKLWLTKLQWSRDYNQLIKYVQNRVGRYECVNPAQILFICINSYMLLLSFFPLHNILFISRFYFLVAFK